MEVENYLSSPHEEVDSTYFFSLPVVFLKAQTTEQVWEEYAEIMFTARGWKTARRVVVVRKPRNEEESRQQELFPEYADLNRYEYGACITNMEESVAPPNEVEGTTHDPRFNGIKHLPT